MIESREKPVKGMLEKYIRAIRGSDMKELESLLTEDIAFYADGGNTINVYRKFAAGAHEVAELLQYVYERYDKDLSLVQAVINHQPALLYYREAHLVACQVFILQGLVTGYHRSAMCSILKSWL